MDKKDRKNPGSVNASGISYGELIRAGRRNKGMNQEELGQLVHVGKNAVGAWESGRSRPDLNSIPVLCETLNLSLYEFFGVREQRKAEEPERFNSLFPKLSPVHQTIILKEMEALIDLQHESVRQKRKLIRLFRSDLSVCAGPSFFIGEGQGDEVWIEENILTRQADELIRVSGDSMEPEFHDGDLALVKHGTSLHPGEIGIFTNGDSGYIKIYQRDGLHSLNPKYPVMKFHDGDEVRCVGKVLGIAEDGWFASEDELT